MTPATASALLPLLHRLDPERAHEWALAALRLGVVGSDREPDDPILAVEALGRSLTNPIGLAAGFDKNGVALAGLMRLGFGLIEAGTVTPRPQQGNPRPRLFRLSADRAVINRMGFNNAGIDALLPRLAGLSRGGVPVGVNVGINKDGADPERDYPALIAAVGAYADYVVINISSPNTPGLRDLQGEARLAGILAAVAAAVPKRPPLLVKIAPDLSDAALAGIVETCVAAGVDGLIISNTTLARPALRSAAAHETGGLSGAPLFDRATAILARAHCLAQGRLLLVGVGGVATGAQAFAKIQAGASLVQVYTALVYGGPALVGRIKRELAIALRAAGFSRLSDAIGSDAQRLAESA